MSKLFKACFGLVIFMAFYIFGYSGTALIHGTFFQPQPTQEIDIAGLAEFYAQQHPDATPWETCEQEVN
jgi:hypothetical protein